MSKVFDKPIIVKKKENGDILLFIAINDETLITKSIKRKTLEQLNIDIEEILDEN